MLFYESQPDELKQNYINKLKEIFLNNINSNDNEENDVPDLFSKQQEKCFSKMFYAQNVAPKNYSVDSIKGDIGVGLKTISMRKKKTSGYRKIAEFNENKDIFREKDKELLMNHIATLRNKRLTSTLLDHNLKKLCYHHIIRKENKFYIKEELMHFIDMNTIKIVDKPRAKKNIYFEDQYNEYMISLGENTLYKKITLDGYIAEFTYPVKQERNCYVKKEAIKGVISKQQIKKQNEMILENLNFICSLHGKAI